MLVIGMIVADADCKGLFSRDVLLYCLIRLAVFPVIIRALLKLVPVDPLIVSITVILAAMPAGSAATILADQYHVDPAYAGACVLMSTLLSMITIPIMGLLL